MAVNPNFTNANATTPYASGGGGAGSNFPVGINITSGVSSNWFRVEPTVYWGQPSLSVVNADDLSGSAYLNPLASQFFLSVAPLAPYKTARYEANTIIYQGNGGSGGNATFLTVNDANLTNGTSPLAFNVSGLSTIQSGTNIANAESLMSTLKGNFPICFL